MDDGNELTVSLKVTLTQSVGLLLDPSPYIGQTIRFTGMGAVKERRMSSSCPLHKGNIRDEK
jgi:hypothetical protein